ncbi:hypothetical protein ACWEQL_39045 [Kitasatospora sp. NPDC004240]
MNDTEAPWHVLEDVAEGEERTPGRLRAMTTPGDLRAEGVAWYHLSSTVNLMSPPALVAPVLVQLLELLPDLGGRRRVAVLDMVRRSARAARLGTGRANVPGLESVLAAGLRTALALVDDADPELRLHAVRVLEEIRPADPAALEALRRQAAAEREPAVLARQLLAAGELLTAARAADPGGWLRPWQEHPDPHVRLAADTARLLCERPPATTRPSFTGYRLDDDRRRAAAAQARTQVETWRRPPDGAWETLLDSLSDDESLAGWESRGTIAHAGSAIAPHADRLIAFVDQEDWRGDCALRALVGLGDRRALPRCLKRLGTVPVEAPPVEALPVAWAGELLTALRQAGTVPAHWGRAAAPATPELIRLLEGIRARAAAWTLGRIGPEAAAAAGPLAALARGEVRPARYEEAYQVASNPWHGTQTAAWAHWRITGDPGLALAVIGGAARAGLGRPVLGHLADLGPLAVGHAPDVRPMLNSVGAWTRVGAAQAWWRLTGDAETAVATLLPELGPLAAGRTGELPLRVVTILGAIGRPAAAAVPLLTEVAASERRYTSTILDDERLQRAVTTALAAMT